MRRGRAGSSSWRPWLLSLAMDVAASRLVAGGAELSQQAARVAAAHPALRGASSAELCRLQARTTECLSSSSFLKTPDRADDYTAIW